MTPCQLIVDSPAHGSWNMAVDEWLLSRAAEQGVFTLRFYEWSEPTLSLGYFQSHQDRQSHAASRELPMIRRASGGGALVHDRELTYSLAVPAEHPLARDSQSLYNRAHSALVDALNNRLLSQSARQNRQICLCPQKITVSAQEPFLCFQRRQKGDVIVVENSQNSGNLPAMGYKVCGSAQRKNRGAILQHGGVLVSQSPFAPELPGLSELGTMNTDTANTATTYAIDAKVIRELWIEPLVESLGLELEMSKPFSNADLTAIGEVETNKFTQSSWTNRR